ncbi:MAG TPA: hypothetical protein VK652_14620 [Steroidobacteraceae bacterium]|nr:hypothetical protein [Steroidobacteraceae bacterium]
MSRRISIMPVMISLLIAAPLIAVPVHAQELQKASFSPREMAHCMMKRFRANHSESYREAYKACKEEFDLAQADRGETAMNEPARAETDKPQ